MRITKDITNTIFKSHMQADPIPTEVSILNNLLTPSLDDILLGNLATFPLLDMNSIVDACYLILLRMQSSKFSFQEIKENAAIASCKKKNEKLKKKRAESAVKAYRAAFHKFNSSPTCLEQDSEGNYVRSTIGFSKNRNISKHF